MNTTSFPPNSLYVRLNGTAPSRTAPIPIPRELGAAWSPEAGSDGRRDTCVKWVAATIVLFVAVAAVALVLA